MLITQSTYSSFVPRPFGSPRRSVIYGPRAFEGPRIGRSGSCRLASRWAHLLGQRGPGADHRPARRYCGERDWPIAAGKSVAVEAPRQAPWRGWLLGIGGTDD